MFDRKFRRVYPDDDEPSVSISVLPSRYVGNGVEAVDATERPKLQDYDFALQRRKGEGTAVDPRINSAKLRSFAEVREGVRIGRVRRLSVGAAIRADDVGTGTGGENRSGANGLGCLGLQRFDSDVAADGRARFQADRNAFERCEYDEQRCGNGTDNHGGGYSLHTRNTLHVRFRYGRAGLLSSPMLRVPA